MTNTSTKQRTELSVIPKGHWRNKWDRKIGAADAFSGAIYPAGVGFGDRRYPSRELAEAHAERVIAANRTVGWGSFAPVYLGPVFFPDP